MSLSTTPAPARTDVAAPRTTGTPVSTRLARRVGIAVAGGSAAWAAGMLAFTNTPPAGTVGHFVYEVSALLFQLGLVALVTLQLRTRATGTGKLARGFLHVEHVLLGLAIASTLTGCSSATTTTRCGSSSWTSSGRCRCWAWPRSGSGSPSPVAGQGAARIWPLVAESWAPVAIPASSCWSGTPTTWVPRTWPSATCCSA